MLRSTLILFFVISTLTACSSTSSLPIRQQQHQPLSLVFEDLFLRGVFNWWEAKQGFRFVRDSRVDGYSAEVELIADGQPYDFKIGDAYWQLDQTCGSANASRLTLNLNSATPLGCGKETQNLVFTPPADGRYKFILRKVSAYSVVLTIRKM